MMKLRIQTKARVAVVFSILSGCVGLARADGDTFVYSKVGSELSFGVGRTINENFAVRGAIGVGSWGMRDHHFGGNQYDLKGKTDPTLSALLDWYPVSGNGFRLTGGLVYHNQPTDNLKGTTDYAGNYSINGNTYSANAVGQLSGQRTFHKFAPYIGVGWESAMPSKKGWRFTSDLGMQLFTGGTTTLSASGSRSGSALAQDIAAEQKRVASDMGSKAVSLGLSVGVAYSF
jgi:hypothetical protein